MPTYVLTQNKKIALSALAMFVVSFTFMLMFLGNERINEAGQASVVDVKEVIEEHMGEH